MKNQKMDINRQNALKIWVRDFGNEQKATDFSGRTIAQSAYNQPDSKFCWSIDHILPKSQGGTNEEKNLICVHMTTNAEKADKFPVFKANGKTFQIVKKNNRWIIEEINQQQAGSNAMAMEIWKKCFGDAIDGVDFSGRVVHKSHYNNKNSDYGWNISQVIDSKQLDYGNVYLANLETIEEQKGKTAFSANEKGYKVKKTAEGYKFVCTSAIEDAFEPAEVENFLKSLDYSKNIWLNCIVISIKAKDNPNYKYDNNNEFHKSFVKIANLCKEMLESQDEKFEMKTMLKKGLIVFKFVTNKKSDVDEVFSSACLLNTYRDTVMNRFNLNSMTIFNALFEISNWHYDCEHDELCRMYPAIEKTFDRIDAGNNTTSNYSVTRWDNSLYISSVVNTNLSAKNKLKNESFSESVVFNEHNLVYTELSKKLKK